MPLLLLLLLLLMLLLLSINVHMRLLEAAVVIFVVIVDVVVVGPSFSIKYLGNLQCRMPASSKYDPCQTNLCFVVNQSMPCAQENTNQNGSLTPGTLGTPTPTTTTTTTHHHHPPCFGHYDQIEPCA